ncbi:MAG: septum formation inhibitor Maf [Ignavibacteria bacterium]|nr:septum formation inhibitor Maf [Ignavibacteria bacterium]
MLQLPYPLILASTSPRRKHLLEQIGLQFSVQPSDVDESLITTDGAEPVEFVTRLALLKAQDVASRIHNQSIVIGADTIVVLNGQILGKPLDAHDAIRMLQSLSGNTHTVYTGIALIDSLTYRKVTAVQQTKVTFRLLNDSEIKDYVATGSPLDKAGSYGIQDDFGAVFVSHIEGCYYTIVGLPLELFYRTLQSFIQM